MNELNANLFANLFNTTFQEVIEKYLLTKLTEMEGRIKAGFEKELLDKLEAYFARYEGRLEALESVINDKTLTPVVERVVTKMMPSGDYIRGIAQTVVDEIDWVDQIRTNIDIDDYYSEIKGWIDEKLSDFDVDGDDFDSRVRSVVRDMTFTAD